MVGNDYSDLAGDASQEYIRFCGNVVAGFPSSSTHAVFEMVDGTLYDRPYLIEGVPFIGAALDTREFAKVHVIISIGSASSFGCTAGSFAVTYPFPFDHVDFGAYPFITVGASFFVAVSGVLHIQAAVPRTYWIPISIVLDFFEPAFIPGVIRDQCPGKMKLVFEDAVDPNRIKCRVTEEGIRVKTRMQRKKVREYRFQAGGVPDRFILVRGTCPLTHIHLWMSLLKRIIQESDMPDDAKPVGKHGKLICIAEMAIDILMSGIRTGGGPRGHKAVGHLVRVDVWSALIMGLETFDQGVDSPGVVFLDVELDAGSVKSEQIGE